MVSPRCASVLLTKAAKKVVEERERGGALLSFSHRRFWKQDNLGQLLTLPTTKLPTQNLLSPVILWFWKAFLLSTKVTAELAQCVHTRSKGEEKPTLLMWSSSRMGERRKKANEPIPPLLLPFPPGLSSHGKVLRTHSSKKEKREGGGEGRTLVIGFVFRRLSN